MAHGTHEHLEEAEHAEHAAHDTFNRNVAMTMAMIAAVLAAITMLSHRSHTETLRLQTLANIRHTQASDMWNYFQAKNIRNHEYTSFLEMTSALAKDAAGAERRKAAEKKWSDQVEKYKTELPEIEGKARALEKEAESFQKQSESVHHQADRFDLGELGVELGLVLASLAVLTRRRMFWLGGVGFAVVGAALSASAFFVH
jgi:predicted ribosome quality control (RQC) complex YloA/Tae2 family protein